MKTFLVAVVAVFLSAMIFAADDNDYKDAFYVKKTDTQSISTNTTTKINFNLVDYDEVSGTANGGWDATNKRWTPKQKGWYDCVVGTGVATNEIDHNTELWIGFRINGGTINWIDLEKYADKANIDRYQSGWTQEGPLWTPPDTTLVVEGSQHLWFDGVDDYLEGMVWHNDPESITIGGTFPLYGKMGCHFVQDAANWQKYPDFQVSLSGTQSIVNGSTVRIDFNVVDDDSFGWWSNTNKQWTPLKGGKYLCGIAGRYPNLTLGKSAQFGIRINGTTNHWSPKFEHNSANDEDGQALTKIITFNGTTDYIEGVTKHTATTSVNLDGVENGTYLFCTFLHP